MVSDGQPSVPDLMADYERIMKLLDSLNQSPSVQLSEPTQPTPSYLPTIENTVNNFVPTSEHTEPTDRKRRLTDPEFMAFDPTPNNNSRKFFSNQPQTIEYNLNSIVQPLPKRKRISSPSFRLTFEQIPTILFDSASFPIQQMIAGSISPSDGAAFFISLAFADAEYKMIDYKPQIYRLFEEVKLTPALFAALPGENIFDMASRYGLLSKTKKK
jgi:hypothetical protein